MTVRIVMRSITTVVLLLVTLILNIITTGTSVYAQGTTEKVIPGSNFSHGSDVPIIKDSKLKAELLFRGL